MGFRNRRWHNLLTTRSGCSCPSRRDVDTCWAGSRRKGDKGKAGQTQGTSSRYTCGRPDPAAGLVMDQETGRRQHPCTVDTSCRDTVGGDPSAR